MSSTAKKKTAKAPEPATYATMDYLSAEDQVRVLRSDRRMLLCLLAVTLFMLVQASAYREAVRELLEL